MYFITFAIYLMERYYISMEIYEILNRYYFLENNDMNNFNDLVIIMINYFKLEKFIDSIEIYDSLEGSYSLYDYNKKQLVFGNNIFNSNLYDTNFCKAIVYILHELIHVIQAKYISMFEKYDILELNILKLSFLNNNISYSSILPLHEYQAFLNSNYILMNYLKNIDNFDDLNTCKNIVTNLLYNNYYDRNINYLSPLEQTIEKFGLDDITYSNLCYNDKEIVNKLLFGMPIDRKDFVKGVKQIRKN